MPNVFGIIISDATDTIIGGTTPSARNVISGNEYGVRFTGGDTSLLEGNYIGTDPTGMIAEGNTYFGVSAYYGDGGSMAQIGGLTATPGTGTGNVISGNGTQNLVIYQARLQAIEGNIIGLNATGTAALGNATTGVYVYDTTNAFAIGGTAPGARNIISGNAGAGIELDGSNVGNLGTVENVAILGNFIGTDITGTIASGTAATASLSMPRILIRSAERSQAAGNVISGNDTANTAGIEISAPVRMPTSCREI